jgi:hypothetical protein
MAGTFGTGHDKIVYSTYAKLYHPFGKQEHKESGDQTENKGGHIFIPFTGEYGQCSFFVSIFVLYIFFTHNRLLIQNNVFD